MDSVWLKIAINKINKLAQIIFGDICIIHNYERAYSVLIEYC